MGVRSVAGCGKAIGPAKPSLPVPVYAEDMSLVVVRTPLRLRLVRGTRKVLN